jgi:hypothetical protein
MQKNDWWKILNICLGIFLLGLVVFIIMMVLGMRTAGDDLALTGGSQIEEYYKPKEDNIITDKALETKTETVTNSGSKKPVVDEKKIEVEDEGDLSTSSSTTSESKESIKDVDSNKSDKKDESEDEIKKLTGKLESADEKKNEFDGNYRLIAEGDTDYTYLWFSGDFKKYVDGLVGMEVVLEVKYADDGTFVIVSGPELK